MNWLQNRIDTLELWKKEHTRPTPKRDNGGGELNGWNLQVIASCNNRIKELRLEMEKESKSYLY